MKRPVRVYLTVALDVDELGDDDDRADLYLDGLASAVHSAIAAQLDGAAPGSMLATVRQIVRVEHSELPT